MKKWDPNLIIVSGTDLALNAPGEGARNGVAYCPGALVGPAMGITKTKFLFFIGLWTSTKTKLYGFSVSLIGISDVIIHP